MVSVSSGEVSNMAIEVTNPHYAPGEKATYVTVNGVKYAIVRADAWFDPIGVANAPAPGGKSLSVSLGNILKGRGKFYGRKAVELSLNPNHPAYCSAVHRATYYPADQVTLTAVSRKKLRPGSSARRKTGRGKVGVGGMRTMSHS
jgi:hypothetical protein